VDDSISITSTSPEMTKAVAAAIAQHAHPGTVIALRGDLGSGKTCFVQGLARVLANEEDVHSPTFTIVNEYGDGPALYHIDLYRLDDEQAIRDLALEDIFDGDAIVAVEWAERAEKLLPAKRVDIGFKHADEGRAISIRDHGGLTDGWCVTIEHG
jgi:tRNA threonylcarbamoyladenosine biosynthesis protein TsaE